MFAILVEHDTLENGIYGPFASVKEAVAHGKERDFGVFMGLDSLYDTEGYGHGSPPETTSEYLERGGKRQDWTFTVYRFHNV